MLAVRIKGIDRKLLTLCAAATQYSYHDGESTQSRQPSAAAACFAVPLAVLLVCV
jgi:hypothetical protein